MKFFSKKNRSRLRFYKTLTLAIVATATLAGGAIYSWDVEPEEMLNFFVMSLTLLGILMVLGLAAAGLMVLIRKMRG